MFTKYANFSKHYKGISTKPFNLLLSLPKLQFGTILCIRKNSEYNTHKTVQGEQFMSLFSVHSGSGTYSQEVIQHARLRNTVFI